MTKSPFHATRWMSVFGKNPPRKWISEQTAKTLDVIKAVTNKKTTETFTLMKRPGVQHQNRGSVETFTRNFLAFSPERCLWGLMEKPFVCVHAKNCRRTFDGGDLPVLDEGSVRWEVAK